MDSGPEQGFYWCLKTRHGISEGGTKNNTTTDQMTIVQQPY